MQKVALVFQYQLVYDPDAKRFTPLAAYPTGLVPDEIIGQDFGNAERYALGYLHIKSLKERQIPVIDFRTLHFSKTQGQYQSYSAGQALAESATQKRGALQPPTS